MCGYISSHQALGHISHTHTACNHSLGSYVTNSTTKIWILPETFQCSASHPSSNCISLRLSQTANDDLNESIPVWLTNIVFRSNLIERRNTKMLANFFFRRENLSLFAKYSVCKILLSTCQSSWLAKCLQMLHFCQF